MNIRLKQRFKLYQVSIIFSLLFTLVGFSYNTWRLQQSELNNNIRTASFEVLTTLAELEQLVYIAHYDQHLNEGNPRKGWIKVGLINDLSLLTNTSVQVQAQQLHEVWHKNWHLMAESNQATEHIVMAINEVRNEVKILLKSLQ